MGKAVKKIWDVSCGVFWKVCIVIITFITVVIQMPRKERFTFIYGLCVAGLLALGLVSGALYFLYLWQETTGTLAFYGLGGAAVLVILYHLIGSLKYAAVWHITFRD